MIKTSVEHEKVKGKGPRTCLLILSAALALAASSCKKKEPGKMTEPGKAESMEEKIRRLDHGSLEYIRKLDGPGLLQYKRKTGITICGIGPIALMLEALKMWGKPVKASVLSYYTSGHVVKDWTNTVSYFSIGFFTPESASSDGKPGTEPAASAASSAEKGTGASGAAGGKRIRRMATGPGWYSKDPERLRPAMSRMLDRVAVTVPSGRLVALISPHAGLRFSGKAAASGYKLARATKGLKRAVVIGVSHFVRFQGVSVPEATHYETPFGLLPVDLAAIESFRGNTSYKTVTSAHVREHSVEMQLVFLGLTNPRLSIVPMLVGQLPESSLKEAARPIAALIDEKTLLVASSDFTHQGPSYGYEPFSAKGKKR